MEAALVWAQEDIASTQTKKEQVMRIGKGTSRTARWLLAAVMAFGASVAMAQVTNTRHNLGTTAGNPGATKVTAGTAEICVFCHTPHAADVTTAGIPLWNKRLNTGSATAFTTYSSSSTMNAVLADDGQVGNLSIGSVSLACLSCHDGTQAMDNILNAPGSGGYDVTGGGTNGLAYTWAVGGNSDINGLMTNTAAGSLAMLGRDLSNDHPIGIQYCGGGPGAVAPTGACLDADFRAPSNASIGGQTVFWVENLTAVAGRQKTDMILYNRNFPANGTLAGGIYPSVECGSCHDPHSSANPTFLRVSNAGSAVCLTCHNK